MKKSSTLSLALLASSIYLTTPALAEDSFYEIQYMFVDSDLEGVGFEPKALLFKYIKPYSSYIDFQAIAALGIDETKVKRKDPTLGNYTQKYRLSNILGVSGKIHTELEPSVLLYGHLGLARVEYHISSSVSGASPDGSVDDIGAIYGIGLSFSVFKKGAFIVDYSQFPDVNKQGNSIDTAALSVGYQMPF